MDAQLVGRNRVATARTPIGRLILHSSSGAEDVTAHKCRY